MGIWNGTKVLIQALLKMSPCHHGKQTKSFVLVTTVVQ
jgi:hypothetical protein